MEYVHAAIILHKAGKPVNEENLMQVLNAAGINTDPIRVKALVASLAEINIEETLKSAMTFAPTAVAPTAAPAPTAEAKPAEEKKKTAEEEKKKEEAAIEGLGALFG